jgi:putative transposase
MTVPRQILPGQTYLITRRCAHRDFRLAPSAEVNEYVGYCVAEAAALFGVVVHAVIVMSNHIHMVVTDREARCPMFTSRAHRHIATCMNARFGWTENFWSTSKTSLVVLEDASAVQRKLVYALVNPVAARLVEKVADWPGLHTADLPFGSSRTFKRPTHFFRSGGNLPETATLELVTPPALADLSDEECTALIKRAVEEREAELRESIRAAGKKFLGRKRCLRISRTDRPSSDEEPNQLSPTFAATDRARYEAALERRRAFLAEYRDAYQRWRAGDREVEFPPGTYWLRVHAGVRCRAPT